MAKFTLFQNLPFTEVTLRANGKSLTLPHVLIDTGSGGSAFKTDDLLKLDVFLEPTDMIVFMRGIGGGREPVVQKQIESIEIDNLVAAPFTIQLGGFDYHLDMDGIIGADFLLHVGAQLDFKNLEIQG